MESHTDSEGSLEQFLANWERELRCGDFSDDPLEVLEYRVPEYAGLPERPAWEAEALKAGRALAEQYLSWTRQVEAAQTTPTVNDRIEAAFTDLAADGIVAIAGCGKTIQDGWGYVGLAASGREAGAVFFHQEDVLDATDGLSLPLAFGAFAQTDRDLRAQEIALATMTALARRGVEAHWSGRVSDRIEVAPFNWLRRRVTSAPPVPLLDLPPAQLPSQLAFLDANPADDFDWSPYEHQVVAGYDSQAFDLPLSYVMRGVWRRDVHGRGQIWHAGPPHIFVPAGEVTSFRPGPALTNLPLADVDKILLRARRSAPDS